MSVTSGAGLLWSQGWWSCGSVTSGASLLWIQGWWSCGGVTSGAGPLLKATTAPVAVSPEMLVPSGASPAVAASSEMPGLWKAKAAVPCGGACTSVCGGTHALETPSAHPHEELGLFHATLSPIMWLVPVLGCSQTCPTSLCPAGPTEPDWSQPRSCSDLSTSSTSVPHQA